MNETNIKRLVFREKLRFRTDPWKKILKHPPFVPKFSKNIMIETKIKQSVFREKLRFRTEKKY